ncbi:hypothetical protein CFP56_034173 [Quercus suber]|uniref:Uncharacterized protein n=1 Tax=Quercus suber TaxID=58331 RepID=A0AAW0LSE5_QUESU
MCGAACIHQMSIKRFTKCPDGYKALGLVVTNATQKPSLDKISCVKAELTEQCEHFNWIWGAEGINVYTTRPSTRGTQAMGVHLGSFVAQDEFDKIMKRLPKFLRGPFRNVFYKLPIKILEEEGPASIKTKSRTGFATRFLSLGDLIVSKATDFEVVWRTHSSGPDNLGATFFEPSTTDDTT